MAALLTAHPKSLANPFVMEHPVEKSRFAF